MSNRWPSNKNNHNNCENALSTIVARYIIQVKGFLNQACTWFLEIAFVWEVGMCVCLYLSAPGLLKTTHVK